MRHTPPPSTRTNITSSSSSPSANLSHNYNNSNTSATGSPLPTVRDTTGKVTAVTAGSGSVVVPLRTRLTASEPGTRSAAQPTGTLYSSGSATTTPLAMQRTHNNNTTNMADSNSTSARHGLGKGAALNYTAGSAMSSAAPPTIPAILPLPLTKSDESGQAHKSHIESDANGVTKGSTGGIHNGENTTTSAGLESISPAQTRQRINHQLHDIQQKLSLMHADIRRMDKEPPTTTVVLPTATHPSVHHNVSPMRTAQPLLSVLTQPTNITTTTTTTVSGSVGSEVTVAAGGGGSGTMMPIAGKRQLAPLPTTTSKAATIHTVSSPSLSPSGVNAGAGTAHTSRPHSPEMMMKKLLPPTTLGPASQVQPTNITQLSPIGEERNVQIGGGSSAKGQNVKPKDSPTKSNTVPSALSNGTTVVGTNDTARGQRSETSSTPSPRTRSPLVKVGTGVFSAGRTDTNTTVTVEEATGSHTGVQETKKAANEVATHEAHQTHKTRTAPRPVFLAAEEDDKEKEKAAAHKPGNTKAAAHGHHTNHSDLSSMTDASNFTLSSDVHGGSLPLLESPPSSSSDDDDTSSSSSEESSSSSSEEVKNTKKNNQKKHAHEESAGRGTKQATVMTAEQYTAKAHNVPATTATAALGNAQHRPQHDVNSNSNTTAGEATTTTMQQQENAAHVNGQEAASAFVTMKGADGPTSDTALPNEEDNEDYEKEQNNGNERDPFALSSTSSETGANANAAAGRGGNAQHHRAGRGVMFIDDNEGAATTNVKGGEGAATNNNAQFVMTSSMSLHTPAQGKAAFTFPPQAATNANAGRFNASPFSPNNVENEGNEGEMIVPMGRRQQNTNKDTERHARFTPTPPQTEQPHQQQQTNVNVSSKANRSRKEPTPPGAQGSSRAHGSAGKKKEMNSTSNTINSVSASAQGVARRIVAPPPPPPVTAHIPHSTNNTTTVGFVDDHDSNNNTESLTRVSFLDAGGGVGPMNAAPPLHPMTPSSLNTPGSAVIMTMMMPGADSERAGPDANPTNPNNTSLLLSSFNRSGMTMMQSLNAAPFGHSSNKEATSPSSARGQGGKRLVAVEEGNGAATPQPRRRSLSLSVSHQTGSPQGMEKEGPQQKIRQRQHRAKRIRDRFFTRFPCLSEVIEYEGLRFGFNSGQPHGKTHFAETNNNDNDEEEKEEDEKKNRKSDGDAEANVRSSNTPTPNSMATTAMQDVTRPNSVEDLFLVGAPCSWLVCIALALSYVSELPITIEDILRVNRLSVHNISLPAITLAQLYDMTMDYLTNCLYETEDYLESGTSESKPLPLGASRKHDTYNDSASTTSEDSETNNAAKGTNSKGPVNMKSSMKACTAAEIFRGLSGLQCEMATFNSDIVDPESAELAELRELGEHPPVTSLAQLRKELLAHINEEGSIYVFNYNPHIVEQYELRLRSNLAETEEEMAAIMASARYTASNRGNFGILLDFSPVVHTVTIATPHLMRERYPMHDIHFDDTDTSNTTTGNKESHGAHKSARDEASHSSVNTSGREPLLTTVSELTPFLDLHTSARRGSARPTLADVSAFAHDPNGTTESNAQHSKHHSSTTTTKRDIDVSKIVTTDIVLEVHTIALQTFYEAVRDVDSYTMLSRGFVRIYQRYKASTLQSEPTLMISGNELIAQARASVSHPIENHGPVIALHQNNSNSTDDAVTTTVIPSIFPLFVLDGSSSGGLITSTLDVTIAPHILGLCIVHHLAITFLLSDNARRRQSSRNLLSKANVCDVKLRGIPLTKICQQLHLPMSMIVSESRKDAIAMAFAWYSVFLRQLQIHHEVHIGLVTPTRRDDAEDGQPSLSEEDFLAHLKLVVRTASIMLIGFNVNRALNVTIRPIAEPFHCAIVVGVDESRGVVRLADVNVKRFRKTWHLPISRLYNATMGYGYLVAAKEKRTIKSLHGKADAARALTNARYALPPQISTGLARFEYPARPYPITVLADAVERLGFEGTTVEKFMNFSGFHITYFLSRHMSLEGAAAVAQNYSHYALDDAMTITVTHYDYYEGHPPQQLLSTSRRPMSSASNNARTPRSEHSRPMSSQSVVSTATMSTAYEEAYAALHRIRTVEEDLIPALQHALQSPTTRKLLVNFDHAVIERYTEVWNGGEGGNFAIVLNYDSRSRLVTLMDANVNSFYRVFAWPVTVLFEAMCSFDPEGLRARGTLLLSKDTTQEAIYENGRGYDLAHALVHHPFRPIFSAPCSCLALAATEMMMNIALPDNYLGGPRGGGGMNGQRLSMSSQSLNREAERKKYQRYSNIFSAEDFLYAVPTFSVHEWQAERIDTKDMTSIANDAFRTLHLPLNAVNVLAQTPEALNEPQAFLQACRGTSGLVTIVLILYDTDKIHGVPGTSMGLVNRVEDLTEDNVEDEDDDEDNTTTNNNNEEGAALHQRTRSMATTQGGAQGRVQLVEGDPCRWGTYCERTAEEWMPAVLAIISIEPAEELESQWII